MYLISSFKLIYICSTRAHYQLRVMYTYTKFTRIEQSIFNLIHVYIYNIYFHTNILCALCIGFFCRYVLQNVCINGNI